MYNAPDKPLASGAVTTDLALLLSSALYCTVLIVACFLVGRGGGVGWLCSSLQLPSSTRGQRGGDSDSDPRMLLCTASAVQCSAVQCSCTHHHAPCTTLHRTAPTPTQSHPCAGAEPAAEYHRAVGGRHLTLHPRVQEADGRQERDRRPRHRAGAAGGRAGGRGGAYWVCVARAWFCC